MMHIAVFTALPQEHAPFRRKTGKWLQGPSGSCRRFLKRLADREFSLFESGMGKKRIETALEGLYEQGRPDLVISAGFAGSLDPGLRTGNICLGVDYLTAPKSAAQGASLPVLSSPAGPTLERVCRSLGLIQVRLATVEEIQEKQALRRRLGETSTLVDMETYFAARIAAERGTAFLSIRSVSDGLEDEIDFDVESLTDSNGRVMVPKVIRSTLRSPRLALSLLTAWRRSRLAGAALAEALRTFLALPLGDLERIVEDQHVSIRGDSERQGG